MKTPTEYKIRIDKLVAYLKYAGVIEQNFSNSPAVALEPDPDGEIIGYVVFKDLRSV